MIGVILAAGCGSRLSAAHNGRHSKVLLRVAGRAIIDHTLEAFSQVGVTDLAIVVGFEREAVRQWVGDGSRWGLHIQYVCNPDYLLGNALSVYAAKSFAKGAPFLLSMADHMISPVLLESLLKTPHPTNVLAVDFDPSAREVAEGTKVLVGRNGLVTRIGKGLSRWNGIDAGVFRLTSDIFEAIEVNLATALAEQELSEVITQMIRLGNPLEACDISGCFWQDIDTWEDLNVVRRTLAESG